MGHMSPRLKARRGRFGVGGLSAPVVTILSPADGFSTGPGSPAGSPIIVGVAVQGQAIDDLQGDISASIQWTSNIDGAVGSGASTTLNLSVGTHTITASASDGALTGTDSITVTITS